MITKKHREYDFTNSDNFLIVSNSREQIFKELDEYINNTKNVDKVYIYEHNVRPSKLNNRPEYCMEVDTNMDGVCLFYRVYTIKQER